VARHQCIYGAAHDGAVEIAAQLHCQNIGIRPACGVIGKAQFEHVQLSHRGPEFPVVFDFCVQLFTLANP
jgi:hypothetical protein